MRRKRQLAAQVLVVMLTMVGGSPVSADDGLAKTLHAVLQAQADAISRGNIDEVLKAVHSQSPVYFQAAKGLKDMASVFKVRAEVSDFKLIGVDGEYAFGRCSEKTAKVSGPAFHDNVRDVLEVFRKEGGAWKEWTSVTLTTRFLDSEERKTSP